MKKSIFVICMCLFSFAASATELEDKRFLRDSIGTIAKDLPQQIDGSTIWESAAVMTDKKP